MASRLGDAFVAISAQGKDFGTQVSKLTKTATETASKLYGSVNITAKLDDAGAKTGVRGPDRAAGRAEQKVVHFHPADIKDKGFAAKRLDLLAKIDAMSRKKIEPDIELGEENRETGRVRAAAAACRSRHPGPPARSAGWSGIGGGGGASAVSGAAGGASCSGCR